MRSLRQRLAFGSLIAGLAFAGLGGVAQADTITWNFSGGCTVECGLDGSSAAVDGNTRDFSAGGITVTATAWSLTGNLYGVDTSFETAFLGHYSGGLGVTNKEEDGSSNTHTLDNYNTEKDIIGFLFSGDVVVTGANLSAFGDTDISVWVGSSVGMPNLTTKTFADLDAAYGARFTSNGGSSSRFADFSSINETGNLLLIAAKVGDSPDAYPDKVKIASVTGHKPPPVVTPEPSSLALLGLGALGLGVLRRRRRAA